MVAGEDLRRNSRWSLVLTFVSFASGSWLLTLATDYWLLPSSSSVSFSGLLTILVFAS